MRPPVGYNYMEMVKLIVDVPLPTIQATKTFNLDYLNYKNQINTITETVYPDSGYNAMSNVIITYRKINVTSYIYVQDTDYSSTENGVIYYRDGYTPPSNDNITTSAQRIMYIRAAPDANNNFFAMNTINCYMRIQHKTITSNGTYYPYNNNTVIKKIVVNVPTINNTTKTITSNGTYTPDSPYTGFSSVVVNVTGTVNNTTKDITSNGTYTPDSPYTGFSSVTVNVPSKKNIIFLNIVYTSVNGGYHSFSKRLIDIRRNGTSVSVSMASSSTNYEAKYYGYYFGRTDVSIFCLYFAELWANGRHKYLIGCNVINDGYIYFPMFRNSSYTIRLYYEIIGSHSNHSNDWKLQSAVLTDDSNVFAGVDNYYSEDSRCLIQFPKEQMKSKYLILDQDDFYFES